METHATLDDGRRKGFINKLWMDKNSLTIGELISLHEKLKGEERAGREEGRGKLKSKGEFV